jgi:uncharacterized protein with FMN-binding domain
VFSNAAENVAPPRRSVSDPPHPRLEFIPFNTPTLSTVLFPTPRPHRSTRLTPRHDLPPNSSKATEWITGNLVSLGSVAVLAVYAAGYARTAEAARRFEDEDRRRHEAVRPSVVAAPTVLPSAARDLGPAAVAREPVKPTSDNRESPKPAPKSENKIAVANPAKTDTALPPAAQRTDTVPTPAPVTAAAVVAPTQDTVQVKGWKDGSYTGWGGSRHGDIQATVEIKDGKISATWISICATQYSCSWLDALPGQVVARQSPEVDFVSGATQSTNAFYYAVVQALRKAK